MTAEEQRAADYRAEQVAKAHAIRARIVGLAGSVEARAALQAAWVPVWFVGGPLVGIARGMFADTADMAAGAAGGADCADELPFTGQLV